MKKPRRELAAFLLSSICMISAGSGYRYVSADESSAEADVFAAWIAQQPLLLGEDYEGTITYADGFPQINRSAVPEGVAGWAVADLDGDGKEELLSLYCNAQHRVSLQVYEELHGGVILAAECTPDEVIEHYADEFCVPWSLCDSSWNVISYTRCFLFGEEETIIGLENRMEMSVLGDGLSTSAAFLRYDGEELYLLDHVYAAGSFVENDTFGYEDTLLKYGIHARFGQAFSSYGSLGWYMDDYKEIMRISDISFIDEKTRKPYGEQYGPADVVCRFHISGQHELLLASSQEAEILQEATPYFDGIYQIRNSRSGLLLDVYGESFRSEALANVQVYAQGDADNYSQQFRLLQAHDGWYSIIPESNTELAVNPYSIAPAAGDNINTYALLPEDSTQGWYLVSTERGYIIANAWNSRVVLAAEGEENKSNVSLQWFVPGDERQYWLLDGSLSDSEQHSGNNRQK